MRRDLAAGRVDLLPASIAIADTAKGLGPAAALKKLQLGGQSAHMREAWAEEARLEAVLGGFSLKPWRSGVRCYVAFIGAYVRFAFVLVVGPHCVLCRCMLPGHHVLFPTYS